VYSKCWLIIAESYFVLHSGLVERDAVRFDRRSSTYFLLLRPWQYTI